MILPYPPKELNPNSRNHWAKIALKKKQYREACGWIAKTEKPRKRLVVTFHPPDKRRRDRDNVIAAFKAGQDGIADAWGVDDSEFEITYRSFGEIVKGGKVVVE